MKTSLEALRKHVSGEIHGMKHKVLLENMKAKAAHEVTESSSKRVERSTSSMRFRENEEFGS